jgi:hypothetical protein
MPLCEKNAVYVRAQRASVLSGASPPDFPQIDIEKTFDVLRTSADDLTPLGRRQFGFDAWPTDANDGATTAGDVADVTGDAALAASSAGAVPPSPSPSPSGGGGDDTADDEVAFAAARATLVDKCNAIAA